MSLRRNLAPLALAAAGMLVAAPAMAYPTAVWNVPTGKTTAGGNLHLADYVYSNGTATTNDTCLMFGLLPGMEIGGMPGVGAVEAGVDLWDYPTSSIFATFHGKLQLMGEHGMMPAVAVGGLGLADTSNMANSDNFVYLSLTKELTAGEFSLGSFTLGGFMANATKFAAGPNGVMGGWSREVFPSVSLAADYTSGMTAYSGANVYASYAVTPTVFVSAGYYLSNLGSTSNMAFLALDIDVPTGLYGN